MGEGPQQPLQVVQGFWRPTTRQQQQPPLAVQPSGPRGEGAETIHHWVARGGGPHPVAPQAPGRECIAHGHQAATGPAHQGPFPGIPFAALAVVIGVSQGAGPPTGRWRRAPGVIAFWGADKAVGAASGPGQQQGQQVADRQHGLPSPAPAAHQAPLAPAQLDQAGTQVLQQAGDALVAEAAAGQGAAGAVALQQPLAFGGVKGGAHAHQWHHQQLQTGLARLEGPHHLQGDQIFPMAVAQDQESVGHAMADTIRSWEFAPRRRHGQVVRQRIANPLSPVRIWVPPFL